MARSVNKIILVGNVSRSPELLRTASGKRVAHLSLVTSRRVPRGDGFEEWTEWHRLTLWDRLAQFAADYVRVGDRVYAEGRIGHSGPVGQRPVRRQRSRRAVALTRTMPLDGILRRGKPTYTSQTEAPS